MNLIIDIGNTNSKLALFEGDKFLEKVVVNGIPTVAAIENFSKGMSLSAIAVSSVRNLSNTEFIDWSNQRSVLYINGNTPVPIHISYLTPETLGVDRLCAAVAAGVRFKRQNVLVIDAGTCITYDLITASGEMLGGGITPGVRMRLEAMHHFTSKLPLVELPADWPEIGNSTVASLQFGALHGALAEIQGIIKHFDAKLSGLNVILTGGDYSMFEQRIEKRIFAAPNLVLEGINQILLFNEQ